jgi:hypothetical protein
MQNEEIQNKEGFINFCKCIKKGGNKVCGIGLAY